ncbi:unnamed protein product, partial [Sphenostylis stenocarpa]
MLGTRHVSDGDIFPEGPRALMARGIMLWRLAVVPALGCGQQRVDDSVFLVES